MPSSELSADVRLGVHLSAICARNQYTTDPESVIAELRQLAGARDDILVQEAGTWAGFHEADPNVQLLTDALKELPGVGPWVELGRKRWRAPMHGARGDVSGRE